MQDDRHRFGHYLQRYLAHDESLKLEGSARVNVLRAHISAQDYRRALREAILDGLERLQMARKTLKSSYVLGYYQRWGQGNSRKGIFEDLQNLLETRAEALSKAIEDTQREIGPNSTAKEHDEHRAEILRHMDAVRVNMNNLVDVCERDLVLDEGMADAGAATGYV